MSNTPWGSVTRFYIGCDLCTNWYHGECVGITEKEAKKMDDYICAECKRAQEGNTEELYCICQTPYDESQYVVTASTVSQIRADASVGHNRVLLRGRHLITVDQDILFTFTFRAFSRFVYP